MADCFILRKENSKTPQNTYVDGIVNEYNDFANNEWVKIEQNTNTSFTFGENNTIEFCFKYTSLGSEGKARVFETKDTSANVRLIAHINSTNDFSFSLNKETWYEPPPYGTSGHTIPSYTTESNTLYTLSFVNNTTQTDIYINGLLFTSINEIIPTETKIDKLLLKGSFTVSERYMQGRIYSIRMYNRALTKDEITHNQMVDIERYGNEV